MALQIVFMLKILRQEIVQNNLILIQFLDSTAEDQRHKALSETRGGWALPPKMSMMENWGKVISKRPVQKEWISSS